MKNVFILPFVLLLSLTSESQTRPTYGQQLHCLDSIAHSNSISSHLAKVYYDLLVFIDEKFKTTDTATQQLVQKFEADFAASYINACEIYQQHLLQQLPAWKNYFASNELKPVQYKLLGANAHLNGGFAETVTGFYRYDEWQILNKHHSLFAVCLNKTYKKLYKEAFKNNNNIKLVAVLTLGIDKLAGLYYLHKWTNRQRRLIDYHYSNNHKYSKLLDRVNRKKESFDKLIVKLL